MNTNSSVKGSAKTKYRFVLSILLVLLLGACSSQTPDGSPHAPPGYWPTEGWRTSTPEEQGMDSEKLTELIDYLRAQNLLTIHSLLIIRNGYVVTDAYFDPYTPDMLHDLASVTKSFTSTLIGIAIDKGYIEGVEQPILDFFPERTVAILDTNKEAMTLEDLLTMRSGFECNNQPAEIALSQMMESQDWVQFALDLPMAAKPGTRFAYCSPNVHLLSAIVQETSGMSALAFAEEHLFGPLGISDVIWPPDPQGINWGWGEMKLSPYDMAKLGYLYLQQGEWDGLQVLSSGWAEAATSSDMSPEYGYLWWLDSSNSYYYADGRDGQRIFVFPAQNMVVVTTAGGGSNQYEALETMLTSYVVPAAESETPLPANPDGVAVLESKVQGAASSVQPEPVPPLPEIAQRVAGQTFVMDSNPAGLQSGSFAFPEEAEAVLSLSFVDGNQLEWLIGLDNVYRLFPGNYGLLEGAKGWWESENVFVIDHNGIGNLTRERVSVTFEEDQITIQIQGPGGEVTLVGRPEE